MIKLKKLWLFGSFVAILLFGRFALCEVVPDLYEATLPSTSQADNERHTLFKQGLIEVLERVSGENDIEKQPNIKQAIEQASDYVEQYSYGENVLTVKYNAEQINHLVYQLGHTVWGQRRPNIILWLALEEQNDRRLVGVESDPAIQSFITQVAKEKGLPLILPLMDLEDVSSVTVTDVWGQFPSVLQQASSRYGAKNILVGRVTHLQVGGEDSWEGRWQILESDENPVWTVQGKTLQEVLSQGISHTTQYFMAHYGATNKNTDNEVIGQPILVGIEDIKSSSDFEQAQAYLSTRNQVVEVNVHEVLGNMAVFAVTLQGDNGRQILEQSIHLDQSADFSKVDLAYRWSHHSNERGQ